MTTRKLMRSTDDRLIFGVCGGLGEYFGIDPTVVRVVWVVASLLFGMGITGIILYLILWLLIPPASQ